MALEGHNGEQFGDKDSNSKAHYCSVACGVVEHDCWAMIGPQANRNATAPLVLVIIGLLAHLDILFDFIPACTRVLSIICFMTVRLLRPYII